MATYNVNAIANPNGSGTITGTGTYTDNQQATLNAIANAGYEFDSWTLDNYTRLEYIESVGKTQYIDTGIYSKCDLRVVLDGLWTKTSGTEFIFGGRNDNSSRQFSFAGNTADSLLRFDFYSSNRDVPSSYIKPTTFSEQRFTMDANKNVWTLSNSDGVIYTYTFNTTGTAVSNSTIVLCALKNSNSIQLYSQTRIYSCKIYDNDELMRDFIPAIRHSDGQVGLLDLVHLKFYGNNGTGSFVGGQPV